MLKNSVSFGLPPTQFAAEFIVPVVNKLNAATSASATGSNFGSAVGNLAGGAWPSRARFEGSLSLAAFQEANVGYSFD